MFHRVIIIVAVLLQASLSTGRNHNKPKAIRLVKEYKRSVAGSVDSSYHKTLDLEKGVSFNGDQIDDNQVDPILTSVSIDTGCHYKMDLALVFDSSHTMAKDSWERMKQAAKDVVHLADISPQGTHVSILVYGSDLQDFFVFDNNTSADSKSLLNMIDGLKFYDSWSRMDIALNAVVNYVFTPENGARSDVPKVVLIFTDGNVDGPSSPDDIPNWSRILSKPLNESRHKNITVLAVASGKKSNNYQQLELIGGDKNNVLNINDTDTIVSSLMQLSQWDCPNKPVLCTSTPSSCLTSRTCSPGSSTCSAVIPSTTCTLITTTCQPSIVQTTSVQTQTSSQTAPSTWTPVIVQATAMKIPTSSMSASQASSQLNPAAITLNDDINRNVVRVTTTHYVYVTVNRTSTILLTSTSTSMVSNIKPTLSISLKSTLAQTNSLESTVQSRKITSLKPTVQSSRLASSRASSAYSKVTSPLTSTITSTLSSSASSNIKPSSASLKAGSSKSKSKLTMSEAIANQSAMLSLRRDGVLSNSKKNIAVSPVTIVTVSSSVTSSSVKQEPLYITLKPALKNRFVNEKSKSTSWYDTIVPEFVRKWMAIEP